MTNRTNKVIKRLLYDEQKQWHNENNWSIFQDHLLSKGVTSYRHPTTATAGLDDKAVFLGDENQINHFNANPADIAKNIMVSRYGPQWEQVGSDIDGEVEEDLSGFSVSMSADGTVVAISAYGNSNFRGNVRIYKYYTKDGTLTWHQQGQDIDGKADTDNNGWSVSLSADGSIVAIGATGNTNARGHVRVYEFNSSNSSWEQLGEDINGEAAVDQSGYSVSLNADGTIVAIGAIFNTGVNENNNDNNSGHVRVYQYDPNKNVGQPDQTVPGFGPAGWNRLGGDIDGEAANDFSGLSVSLSADGSIVAISAPYNDGVNALDSGHVRVYQYDPNKNVGQPDQTVPGFGPAGWNRLGGDIDGEAPSDYSGSSFSLSADGSIIAIGSKKNDGINGSDSGHVRVYQYDATKTEAQLDDQTVSNFGPVGWNRLGQDIDGEAPSDNRGSSVSLSADGTIVAIADEQYGNNRGRVTVYQYDPNKLDWLKVGEGIDGEAEEDKFGNSVSLSDDGSVLAIGAHKNDGNGNDSGHVRVYQIAKRNPWVQQGLEILGNQIINTIDDQSACSTSISNNGDVIAIGSRSNNDAGLGDRTGHVRIYEKNEGLWKQKGFDIRGEAENDETGFSVSLNGNGNFVAVGSPQILGNDDGYICVYEYREYTSNDNGKRVITQSSDTQPEEGEFYWIQVGQVIEKESSVIGTFGAKLSLSDDGLIIATSSMSAKGIMHVYKYDNTLDEWIKHGGDIVGDAFGDNLGMSASLSDNGSIIAIGAPQLAFNLGGYVKVFSFNSDKSVADENGPIGWNQIGGVIHGKANGDFSGWSVSLSADGSFLAIGAPNNVHNNNDNGPGYVSIYQREPNKTEADENGPIGWNQVGGDIQGEANGDFSGWSVSLSADASFLAIGAPNNNGNGERSGHTRIYQRAPNKTEADENGPIGWIKVGGNIEGEEANESGASVSLNSDGSIVVIAGPLASLETSLSNPNLRARVYKFTGWGLGA